MSESTLNRPSEAPDDSEKEKRLIELLVYIRSVLSSEINEIENEKMNYRQNSMKNYRHLKGRRAKKKKISKEYRR